MTVPVAVAFMECVRRALGKKVFEKCCHGLRTRWFIFSSCSSEFQILPLFILKENFDSSNPEMTRWEGGNSSGSHLQQECNFNGLHVRSKTSNDHTERLELANK